MRIEETGTFKQPKDKDKDKRNQPQLANLATWDLWQLCSEWSLTRRLDPNNQETMRKTNTITMKKTKTRTFSTLWTCAPWPLESISGSLLSLQYIVLINFINVFHVANFYSHLLKSIKQSNWSIQPIKNGSGLMLIVVYSKKDARTCAATRCSSGPAILQLSVCFAPE